MISWEDDPPFERNRLIDVVRSWFWSSTTLSKKYGLYLYVASGAWSVRLCTGKVPAVFQATLPEKTEGDPTPMVGDDDEWLNKQDKTEPPFQRPI